VVSCRSSGAAQRSGIANLAYQQTVLGSLEQNVESGNEGLQLATAGMATPGGRRTAGGRPLAK
jgi:hypothetical protein